MSETKRLKIPVSERIGKVSALTMIPKNAKALLVLAHGAGAGMSHSFMEEVASEFYEHKIGTLRYNFPYMEKGSKRPDPPAIAEKTVGSVIEFAKTEFPQLALFAGGKSFGGRMTSQYLSKNTEEAVQGVVFFGFPLHAIGNPSIDRAEHLKNLKIPMLFLQGTKDKLADIALMTKLVKNLKLGTLKIFEGADHSFKVSKQNILPDLVQSASAWMTR